MEVLKLAKKVYKVFDLIRIGQSVGKQPVVPNVWATLRGLRINKPTRRTKGGSHRPSVVQNDHGHSMQEDSTHVNNSTSNKLRIPTVWKYRACITIKERIISQPLNLIHIQPTITPRLKPKYLTAGYLNARSVKNKANEIADYNGHNYPIPTIISQRNIYYSNRTEIYRTNAINYTNLLPVQRCAQLKNLLTITHLNARSICNKSEETSQFIVDNNIDILAITETWLTGTETDHLPVRCTTPNGYDIIHKPRTRGKGGGVAVIFKKELTVKLQTSDSFLSFEHLEVTVSTGNDSIRLICIYRPPTTSRCSSSTDQFVSDFSKYVDSLATSSGQLLIVGDFNFHLDNLANQNSIKFIDAVDYLNLKQHVSEPTHSKGHMLDLVITRPDACPIHNVTVSPPSLSDHYPITVTVQRRKPSADKIQITARNIKYIDQNAFKSDLEKCELVNNPPDNLDDLVNMYNNTLSHIIDKHAPITTKTITRRHNSEWCTEEVLKAKVECRRAENRWRKNKLSVHLENFKSKCKHLTNICRKAKTNYYQQQISDCAGDQKKLFKITEKLLRKEPKIALPSGFSSAVLADKFSSYFVEKIEQIRATFNIQTTASETEDTSTHSGKSCAYRNLTHFKPISEIELKECIMTSKSKSCGLDPIPTTLLKLSIETLLPTIHKIVNKSLASAFVPSPFKNAIVTPLLKKPSLDSSNLNNYRPISNLPYIAKITEKVVVKQINKHISQHSLHEPLQSAYKAYHSTETALLKVYDDILDNIDNKKYTILILLDLSAAFDTVDHKILLRRLSSSFGITGSALNWLKSYFENRTQHVLINGHHSAPHTLIYGMPQGSVIGPFGFTCYSTPIGNICRKHNVHYHLYADDTQLYFSFSLSDRDSATSKIERCIEEIKQWMSANYLKLNDSKTEYILISSPHQAKQIESLPSIQIGTHLIQPSATARNIGAIFDNNLHMTPHINSICRSCYIHVRNISKIRQHLSRDATEKLIHAFITSRLDNLNSLLIGLPEIQIRKLQKIQNIAARIVTRTKMKEHITPILYELHWLPVKYRIKYKILLLTFKCLHNLAPHYISDLVAPYHPTRVLRSADKNLLIEPSVNTVRYGERRFTFCAPKLWNSLPNFIRECDEVESFKRNIKTFLFKEAYD